MAPRLPGLNYGTPLTIDDLSYLESVYAEEMRQRSRAVSAAYRSAGAAYGIESTTDPVNATDASQPLYVVRNATDDMRVDVSVGACMTPSGMRVQLTEAVTAFEMARQELGQVNVLFLEYTVVADEDTVTRTRYNTTEARRTRIADETSTTTTTPTLLRVVSLTDWQNDATFPPERRADIVMLAVVTVVTADTTLGKRVSVDLSRTNYTDNRPWFSPVDIAHRSFIGTGASTTPHNLGLNDLSQGELSLYDQLVSTGMVIGRDQDAPGVPGSLCMETLTAARLETDTNGTVTGAVSQKYVRLARFPVRLLGAYSLFDTTNEILVELLPHSDILLFSSLDVMPSAGMRVLYTTVQAGEPLGDSLINDEVQVRQPDTAYELLVSGGRAHSQIEPRFTDQFGNSRARISLGTAPAIPKRYKVLLDGDGALLHAPQHLLCATKLDDIGVAAFSFESTMLGAARLRVGLQSVNLNTSTVVTLRLTGTDTTGNPVTEDLTFDYGNYSLPVVGATEENSRNFQVTNTVFATATSLTVITRTADGPNTAACVFADLDPSQTDALRSACQLADVFWDGGRIRRIQDTRRISTSLGQATRTSPVEVATQTVLATLSAGAASNVAKLVGDDLRDPHYFRLDDPQRYWKLNDGLRSASLPEQPLAEALGQGLTQDRYVSRAVRLVAGTSRTVHVALFGRDVERWIISANDGILPNVEYRYSETTSPTTWSTWAAMTALQDGANFQTTVPDLAYKFQCRVKGSVTGVAAFQFDQLGGSQILSGTRLYSAAITSSQTHIVALPFGQSLPHTNYTINVNAYAFGTPATGDTGLHIVKVLQYVDHALAYITRDVTSGLVTWIIHWSLDYGNYVATSDEGFGDIINP